MYTYIIYSCIWLYNLLFIWTYFLCSTVLGLTYIAHNLYKNSCRVGNIIFILLTRKLKLKENR